MVEMQCANGSGNSQVGLNTKSYQLNQQKALLRLKQNIYMSCYSFFKQSVKSCTELYVSVFFADGLNLKEIICGESLKIFFKFEDIVVLFRKNLQKRFFISFVTIFSKECQTKLLKLVGNIP